MTNFNKDISEVEIADFDEYLLELLLMDRKKSMSFNKTSHIIWATDNYSSLGEGYDIKDEIVVQKIFNEFGPVIRPRVQKTKAEQVARSRNKAEVFTPSWLCNKQNNLIDNEWFGEDAVFNQEINHSWITKGTKIKFPTQNGKTWKEYVLSTRLEIACGEAPYLVSRYDTITGKSIPLEDRIGLLDRKIRVINENTATKKDWLDWVIKAYQSIYGFELQGDNLFLARENLLDSFFDYYKNRFHVLPTKKEVRVIADIIACNIWQMDALNTTFLSEEMKFDVVIGNPPYQLEGGSGGNNDAPIYQTFAKIATAMSKRYVSLIIKSAWFTTGRENLLKEFRQHMLTSQTISKLMVYSNSLILFPDVEIKGGCCYYLEDKQYKGSCNYTLVTSEKEVTTFRKLDAFDVLIRNPKVSSIVEKIDRIRRERGYKTVDSMISADTPFGIPSNPKTSKKKPYKVYAHKYNKDDILLYHIENGKRLVEYINIHDIKKNCQDINRYKVFITGAGGSGNDKKILGKPIVAEKNSVCSQSYLYAVFCSKQEAINFDKYLRTKFLRFIVSSIKITQSASKRVYRFVPLIDLSQAVNEAELYRLFELTNDEINLIESSIDVL